MGNALDGAPVYTLYAHQCMELIDMGAEAHVLSEFISAQEAYSIYSRAFRDSARIVDTFPLTGESTKVNLARFFKVYYWEYLSEVYALDLAFGRLLDSLEGASLSYVRREFHIPSRHVELTNSEFISSRMLEVLNEQRPAALRPIQYDNKKGAEKAHGSPYPIVKHLKEMAWSMKNMLMTGEKPVPSEPNPRNIAFGQGGYDALIVIPDALRLSRDNNRLPLLMADYIDKETLRTGLVWKDEYERIERHTLARYSEENPEPPLSFSERKEAKKLYLELMRRLNLIDEISGYGLSADMGKLHDEFAYAVRRTKFLCSVLARFRGSSIVVSDFDNLNARIIEQTAGRFGIETCARPHGWMNSFEAFEYSADHYYCDGPLRARLTEEVYHYGAHIEMIPDPSLMDVSRNWLDMKPSERRDITDKKRAALNINASLVVLLMTTAARYTRALNEFDYHRWLDCWNSIFDYLKSRPDVHVLIKSHRRNFDRQVAALAAREGVTNLTVLGGRLEDALMMADLVVDFGKPGTATLSALLFNCPLLLFRGLYKYVREFGDLVHEKGSSFLVEHISSLIGEIEIFRKDPAIISSDILERNKTLLSELAWKETNA